MKRAQQTEAQVSSYTTTLSSGDMNNEKQPEFSLQCGTTLSTMNSHAEGMISRGLQRCMITYTKCKTLG
jgi:hypothetical protein